MLPRYISPGRRGSSGREKSPKRGEWGEEDSVWDVSPDKAREEKDMELSEPLLLRCRATWQKGDQTVKSIPLDIVTNPRTNLLNLDREVLTVGGQHFMRHKGGQEDFSEGATYTPSGRTAEEIAQEEAKLALERARQERESSDQISASIETGSAGGTYYSIKKRNSEETSPLSSPTTSPTVSPALDAGDASAESRPLAHADYSPPMKWYKNIWSENSTDALKQLLSEDPEQARQQLLALVEEGKVSTLLPTLTLTPTQTLVLSPPIMLCQPIMTLNCHPRRGPYYLKWNSMRSSLDLNPKYSGS